jgi:hypothetical protein
VNSTLRKLRYILVALALALAGLAASPAAPVGAWSALPNGYTNCWSGPAVTSLGDRTCYDVSAGTIYVIDGAGNVYASMGANGGSAGIGNGNVMNAWEWNYVNSTTTSTATITTTATLSANAGRIRVGSAASHDLLEWFAQVGSHEFVTVP